LVGQGEEEIGKEEYAEYLVAANRPAFFGKSADILWLLHLANMLRIAAINHKSGHPQKTFQ